MWSRVMVYKSGDWDENYGLVKYIDGQWVNCYGYRWIDGEWADLLDRTSDKKSYTSTWTSTDMQSYGGNGAKRTSSDAYQGYYSSTWGECTSMYFFNYTSIKSALKGARIDEVSVTLKCNHSYYGSGTEFRVGTHNASSVPSKYSSVTTKNGWKTIKAGDTATFTLYNVVGERLRDGTSKGLVLDANSTSLDYYGYCSDTAKLKIKYYK